MVARSRYRLVLRDGGLVVVVDDGDYMYPGRGHGSRYSLVSKQGISCGHRWRRRFYTRAVVVGFKR
jgi:hypothetical protein